MPNWKKVIVSGSDASLKSLELINTTSGSTVLDIQGTQGQLFSITDDLTGDIFSVSDISGVPILNVNADGTTTFDGNVTLTGPETLDTTSDTSIKFLTRDSNGVVKYHTLGSNAFNSTTIPSAANDATITLTGGGGITTTIGDFTTNQSSAETLTIEHANTSGQASVDNSGDTVIQDVTLDTYGHVTALTSKTLSIPTVNNATLTLSTSAGLDGGVTFTSNQSTAATFNVSLNLSELTDMTVDVVGASDELILLDSGAERRKAINEIKLSQFNNDSAFITGVQWDEITGDQEDVDLNGFANLSGFWNSDDFTSTNISNWNTAYGWGDHSLAGYSTQTLSGNSNYGTIITSAEIRLLDDRRRYLSTADIYTGNNHDYTFYDADVGIRWYTAASEEMRLENDGDLHVDGDVIAFSTTISDKRLKDNVSTIENPLDKIKALRGVEYDWNSGSRKGKRDLGLIAQEVEKVIPNIVHEHELPLLNDDEDDKTLYKTVDYEKLTAVLIEGMKEQQSQIDELKLEINKLKRDI
jgi:hypothetical protein